MTTVARFVLRAIRRRPDLDVMIISLATSSRDSNSLLFCDPRTWFRGVTSARTRGHGEDFVHVGALFGELEFQRLARRSELAALLAECDLIQVVAGVPAWAMPVLDLGKPVALQVATLTTVERQRRERIARGPMALWRRAMTRIVGRLDEVALRKTDVVLVENPWMEAYARAAAAGGATRVVYAPPGVDAELFRPLRKGERASSRPYILAVGRMSDPRKNWPMLLAAYSDLVATSDDPPALALVGPDQPPAEIWSQAATLGVQQHIRMETHPSTERLAELYRSALCLALPSDEEGFGMVVIEAMASGIPVVSTRSGGPDGIITDGVDGFLVDCDDEKGFANRLHRLASDATLGRAMGARARKTVEARYEDEIAGAVYTRVYDELLAQRKSVK